jgi:endonuclease-3
MVTALVEKRLAKCMATAQKKYPVKPPKEFAVIDHLLYAVIQENVAPSRALPVFQKLRASFTDLNELRVSHRREIEFLLGEVRDRQDKAKRILDLLQFVFETGYSYDLESMRKKPIKQAQRQLSQINGMTAFSVAATVQRALGGHAMPVDDMTRTLLVRLGIVAGEVTTERAQEQLEHLVPKAKGLAFALSLHEFAGADDRERESLALEIAGPPVNVEPTLKLADAVVDGADQGARAKSPRSAKHKEKSAEPAGTEKGAGRAAPSADGVRSKSAPSKEKPAKGESAKPAGDKPKPKSPTSSKPRKPR